jgi:hypothetical protein
VLQAVSDPDAAVAELSRVVRPGGQVWVDALNAHCLPTAVTRAIESTYKRERHLRYDTPLSLRRAFERNALGGVQIMWVPILPAWAQRFQCVFESGALRAALKSLPWIGSALSHAYVVTGERQAGSEMHIARSS